MTAEIKNLPNIEWSPQAALHDAINRAHDAKKVIAIWIDERGYLKWSQHGVNAKDLLWIGSYLQQEAMHSDDGVLHSGRDPDLM